MQVKRSRANKVTKNEWVPLQKYAEERKFLLIRMIKKCGLHQYKSGLLFYGNHYDNRNSHAGMFTREFSVVLRMWLWHLKILKQRNKMAFIFCAVHYFIVLIKHIFLLTKREIELFLFSKEDFDFLIGGVGM